MNQENVSYLKDTLKYHGFGEDVQAALEAAIKKETAVFSLPVQTEINKHAVEATLHFKRSDSSDLYFVNKYDLRIGAERSNETVSQTFYFNKGQSVTLKEAYNLLNGRAVHKELLDKEGTKYKAWIQLDFAAKDKNGNYERKQFHENYGYDLREALSYFPLKELGDAAQKEKLLRSLERGNIQSATLQDGTKVFIEANPQYKAMIVYSAAMQRLNPEQKNSIMIEPGVVKEQVKAKQEKVKDEIKESKKKGKEPVVKQEHPGLLNKKRQSKGKGMGV